MHTIDVDQKTAEQALVVIAHQVPPLVDIGRPLVASLDGQVVMVVTTSGLWWVRAGAVERLADLPDGRSELTCWSGGVELSRLID